MVDVNKSASILGEVGVVIAEKAIGKLTMEVLVKVSIKPDDYFEKDRM